uniref:Uncharacterized protein n=1 Tax=Triticum urartu TaxID=4572 RepID=A0A8R7U9I1_TRIUA
MLPRQRRTRRISSWSGRRNSRKWSKNPQSLRARRKTLPPSASRSGNPWRPRDGGGHRDS